MLLYWSYIFKAFYKFCIILIFDYTTCFRTHAAKIFHSLLCEFWSSEIKFGFL